MNIIIQNKAIKEKLHNYLALLCKKIDDCVETTPFDAGKKEAFAEVFVELNKIKNKI